MDLATPVTYVKGVGPQRAEALAAKGIDTAGDLLFYALGGSGIDPAAPLFRKAQRSCISIITHQRVFVR